MLGSKDDWPSVVIAFREREETILRERDEVRRGIRKENPKLHEEQVRLISAVKKQFGIK
jgi:hypothetical protein